MVFAKTWEDFEIAAEAMLMEHPENCRYSMKYTHNQQKLIVKVTNNQKVKIISEDLRFGFCHCSDLSSFVFLYFSVYSTRQKSSPI
jgi:hypothetical protein